MFFASSALSMIRLFVLNSYFFLGSLLQMLVTPESVIEFTSVKFSPQIAQSNTEVHRG